jgi:hypothetical protein
VSPRSHPQSIDPLHRLANSRLIRNFPRQPNLPSTAPNAHHHHPTGDRGSCAAAPETARRCAPRPKTRARTPPCARAAEPPTHAPTARSAVLEHCTADRRVVWCKRRVCAVRVDREKGRGGGCKGESSRWTSSRALFVSSSDVALWAGGARKRLRPRGGTRKLLRSRNGAVADLSPLRATANGQQHGFQVSASFALVFDRRCVTRPYMSNNMTSIRTDIQAIS